MPRAIAGSVILLSLCGLAVDLSGQQAVALRHQVLTTWTTAQGLPQDFITAIEQTPDGFLWIGTFGGLARFDGLRFRTYVNDAPPALRGAISALAVDHEGNLWIGTQTGLFLYKDNLFRPVAMPGRATRVEGLCPAREGGIWARTRTALLRGTSSGTFVPSLDLDMKEVRDFADDQHGDLWLAERDRVMVVRGAKVAATYPLPKVTLLYVAPDQRIFAGDGHRLFLFSAGKFVQQPRSGPDEFVAMLLDGRQQLWMASGGLQGISRLAAGKLELLNMDDGLASNDARVLYQDRNDDLWIGTISGLQRLHVGAFISFTERDGLPAKRSQFDAIFEDSSHGIWAGTLESGISQFRDGHWRNYGLDTGVRRGQVRGFADSGFADHGGKPVFGMADYGLFAWSSGRFRALPRIPSGYIYSPIRTADGSLWFSVIHQGVFRLQNGKLTAYGSAEGLTDNSIISLTPGADGDLWAGGTNALYRWHIGRWQRDLVTDGAVVAIRPARRGGLFLGTARGLVYHNEDTHWKLTQEDGLPAETVLALAEDSNGDLWLATASVICRIPVSQINAVFTGTAKKVTPQIFTEADGLKTRGVLPAGQIVVTRSRDGRIWFATAAAPAVAMPSSVEPASPRALLDSITVDEKRLPPAMLMVAPGRHRITFAFTAPNFVAPEQIRFRYRLTGWDSAWVEAGTTREISYVGLPPGNYAFQVQALGRTGIPGALSVETPLYLKPFFWQTRLFLLVVIAAAIALVIEITRRRTLARVERMNLSFQERAAERERIASQIHDTFIQDLTGAALQLELLGLQFDEDTALARRSLQDLSARLRGMVLRSRDIVFNLYSMAVPQYDLLDLLRHTEAEFRLSPLPAYEVRSEGTPRNLPPFLRDEIYRICREAVANAFRHASATKVGVSVDYRSEGVRVEIVDDGAGMSEQIQLHGRTGHFGLSGMRAHAQRVGATLQVESMPGAGTRIRLEVRARTNGFRAIFLLRQLWERIRTRAVSGRANNHNVKS